MGKWRRISSREKVKGLKEPFYRMEYESRAPKFQHEKRRVRNFHDGVDPKVLDSPKASGCFEEVDSACNLRRPKCLFGIRPCFCFTFFSSAKKSVLERGRFSGSDASVSRCLDLVCLSLRAPENLSCSMSYVIFFLSSDFSSLRNLFPFQVSFLPSFLVTARPRARHILCIRGSERHLPF